jgi:hypothetical protein
MCERELSDMERTRERERRETEERLRDLQEGREMPRGIRRDIRANTERLRRALEAFPCRGGSGGGS